MGDSKERQRQPDLGKLFDKDGKPDLANFEANLGYYSKIEFGNVNSLELIKIKLLAQQIREIQELTEWVKSLVSEFQEIKEMKSKGGK